MGLIDATTGLTYGTGLLWLDGGLGDAGFNNPIPPSSLMATETGSHMITEDGNQMLTE